jgi:hypothetical protein
LSRSLRLAKLVLDLLIRIAISLSDKGSPASTFFATWNVPIISRLYRALLQHVPECVKDRYPDRDVFARTYALLSTYLKDFDSSANVKIPEILKCFLMRNEPLIAIQLHEGFFFLSRTLADLNRHFTRVAGDPNKHLRALREKRVNLEYATVVKNDIGSLVALRSAIKRNHVICCAIDYGGKKGKKPYLNPAILKFANIYSIPVVFIKTRITSSGQAELLYRGPFVNVDVQQCTQQFVSFFNEHSSAPRDVTVKESRRRHTQLSGMTDTSTP